MQPVKSCAAVASVVAAVWSIVAPAYAADITFVSDSGSDTNACLSVAAPCREIGGASGALAKTGEGGVIHVLPGGYLGFIVNKSIEIIADGGQASITAPIEIPSGAGSTEILVEAGPDDEVRIRGFILDGSAVGLFGSSSHGVTFFAGGALHLEDCTLVGSALSSGIAFLPTAASELYVSNCAISGNGSSPSGGGVVIRPTGSGSARAVIDNVHAENNFSGIFVEGRATSGNINMTIRDSIVSGSDTFGFIAVDSGGGLTDASVDRSTFSNNAAQGVVASGANVTVRMRNSTVTGNNRGLDSGGGAKLISNGGNVVRGNTVNGGFSASEAQQ